MTAKLETRGLWKLYGPDGADLKALAGARADGDRLRAAHVVGAVRGVDLTIAAGEVFVIMGLSGSGKSTLVRLLSRLIEPTAGEVLFDGRDITGLGAADLIEIRRHRMGMVFQSFALLPHRSVVGNIAFPLEVQGIDRKTREDRARALVELVGLKGREAARPSELSGGQQQRVGIARALAADPELLFLDEPFSALDPLIRRELQDELIRLQKMLAKTVVFITHDIDEAIRLADRIAIMRDGAVEQVGTAEELVLSPATPYVAAFAGHVAPARVRRLSSLMQPLEVAPEGLPAFSGRATVAEIAPRLRGHDGPILVADDAGRPVGRIERAAIVDVLFGG